MSFMQLKTRQCEPEVMDDPALAMELHHGALSGLTTINAFSASARSIWKTISRLAEQRQSQPLRVLDIATGAGDIPLALWQKARRANLPLEILGVDRNEQALAFARRRAVAHGAELQFRCLDVLTEELPGKFDVVICSLFLHHLKRSEAIELLTKVAATTEHLAVVSDLRRHALGLGLAHLAGRVLTRSPVVRVDAVLSVRAAFTTEEAQQLASEAGLDGAHFARQWPCRYLMTWWKPGTGGNEIGEWRNE